MREPLSDFEGAVMLKMTPVPAQKAEKVLQQPVDRAAAPRHLSEDVVVVQRSAHTESCRDLVWSRDSCRASFTTGTGTIYGRIMIKTIYSQFK